MKQDFSSFADKFVKFKVSDKGPQLISFASPNKDGILVCPSPYENQQVVYHNKNISGLTKHAPMEKQLML